MMSREGCGTITAYEQRHMAGPVSAVLVASRALACADFTDTTQRAKEIGQVKADVATLKQENARLRSQSQASASSSREQNYQAAMDDRRLDAELAESFPPNAPDNPPRGSGSTS
jgi:hypothetical protein